MRFRLNFNSLAVLALMVLLAGVSPAFAASGNVTVTVNISTVSAITVLPTSLSWTVGALGAITPGTDSAVSNVVIKNTGSVNVSNIYLNASTLTEESSNPLSSANASAYSSAKFIMVKNSSDTSLYHVGRLEWNLSSVLVGETLSLAAGVTNYSHGWYKNATGNEYLWKLENGTGGLCNTTTDGTSKAAFTIQALPENSSSLSRNLSTGSGVVTCSTTGSGDNANWGTFSCTSGPLNGHCVAAYYDCSRVYIYRYNYASSLPACGNRQYLYAANLIPGDERSISVVASVPKGTPAGTAQQGTLTIIAS